MLRDFRKKQGKPSPAASAEPSEDEAEPAQAPPAKRKRGGKKARGSSPVVDELALTAEGEAELAAVEAQVMADLAKVGADAPTAKKGRAPRRKAPAKGRKKKDAEPVSSSDEEVRPTRKRKTRKVVSEEEYEE